MAHRAAVLYARVSTKDQEEGYSIDAQLKALRQYAASGGFHVASEFVESETAKRSGRKEFDRMIEAVRSREIKAIIVEKTDRIYRNLKDRVTVDELGIELHLVKEGEVLSRDSRSHAKFIHDIKLVVAKNYIDNLSEETRKGMLEKARQGIYPSHAPIGYLNVEVNGRRVMDIDPERGPLVRTVFEIYGEGRTSIKQLCKIGFEMGLRTKKGKKVIKSALAAMLSNPIYCGLVRWSGETHAGQHAPLVSRDIFGRVQAISHGRRRNNSGYGQKEFTYKGLFTCGYCGCALTAELKKGRYVYYHCTGNRGSCPRPFVREEVFTEHFTQLLADVSLPAEIVEWLVGELKADKKRQLESTKSQLALLEKQESRLRVRLETMYVDKLEGQISPDVYRSLRAKAEEELAHVRLAMAERAGSVPTTEPDVALVLELARTAAFRFKMAPIQDKRELLSHMCSNCLYTDQNVQVSLKKPFDMILALNGQKLENANWLPAMDSNHD